MDFEKIHEQGVKRHPQAWFEANRAAVNAANYEGLAPEQHKAAIAHIVLRVLDVVGAP